MTEQLIRVGDVELCTEVFGDPGDPAILLIMGMGTSMLGWEEPFCQRLADAGRHVIRYDHRDTGRSTTFEPGRPGYDSTALVSDPVGVLGAYDLRSAHLVGVSMGGGIAQLIALSRPELVASLTLISTSPAVSTDRPLPPSADEFMEFVGGTAVDWSDRDSVTRYLVEFERVLAGRRPFDETATRARVHADIERARDFSAAQNHDLLSDGDDVQYGALSSITAPTLVIHGTADPMLPLGHGEALAAGIPGARLLALDGAGHGVHPDDWDTIAAAVLGHTAG